MKLKIAARLRPLLSKHFVQRLPKISIPISVNYEQFIQFWERCPLSLKRSSLVFFDKELIDFVNKTNNKLLYCDLLQKKQQAGATSSQQAEATQQDYQLLNAFEMLWNIENNSSQPNAVEVKARQENLISKSKEVKGTQSGEIYLDDQLPSSENMDLVRILSHDQTLIDAKEETYKATAGATTSKVQGHALTIKDEFISQLLSICLSVSSGAFFSNDPQKAVFFTLDTEEKLFLLEEDLLIKSIDSSLIKNWDDFEYTLALIIENRLLQLYQSHFIDKEYQRKQKKLEQELLTVTPVVSEGVKAPAKPKNKKKMSKAKKAKNVIAEKVLEPQSVQQTSQYIDKVMKIQKYYKSRFQSRQVVISENLSIEQRDISLERDTETLAQKNHEKPKLFDSQKKRRNERLIALSQTPPRYGKQQLIYAATVIDFKREDFQLDFNSAKSGSDKSTTDNFQSDDERQSKLSAKLQQSLGAMSVMNQKNTQAVQSMRQRQEEVDQQRARSSSDGKVYWYWPQMFNYGDQRAKGQGKKKTLILEEIDDVSSESSSGSDQSEELEQYLQECYYSAYLKYEQEARISNHVVDHYNYNPNCLWQNIYMHNQQLEQLMNLNLGGLIFNQSPHNQQMAPHYQARYQQPQKIGGQAQQAWSHQPLQEFNLQQQIGGAGSVPSAIQQPFFSSHTPLLPFGMPTGNNQFLSTSACFIPSSKQEGKKVAEQQQSHK
ncbi:hypothetical protein FGO68_gene6089 [Halteria grandinella]|uniref:Uncharacterized protein n=1 Tax=Halteria grandinella TaxID=5974 RepID=A0A8J8NVJ9_HALGN|nr:hypothetical protein FGO68_gene6089 [Halteria grandinella]